MHSPDALHLSPLDARRFHRRALLLDHPAPNIGQAIAHHGFIQIDPINICGRMHDLILRNRVAHYREGDLMRHLHGSATRPLAAAERTVFEHHLPGSNVLAAMPLEAWPYLLAAMRHRALRTSSWSGKMDPRQDTLAKNILVELAGRGPLCSDDIDDDQRDHHGWGAHASLAKTTLHKLFFHGRVLISRRVAHRRYYDLPECVLPATVLSSPEPPADAVACWLTLLKIRQRRLATLTRAELNQVPDLIQPIAVEGCPPLYCLRTDLPLLDRAPSTAEAETILLAPLDPLIYDRRLTKRLWNFDYTWEVYTPAAKRVRGYYALPVLAGTELVGHIDPKADRASQRLIIVSQKVRRGQRAAAAVRSLASFLAVKVAKWGN